MNRTCSSASFTAAHLAIATGHPSFPEPLHVGCPNVGSVDDLMERIREILGRRWFTNNGPVVQQFERALESYLGVRHCVAICNATVALEISIRALELSGEVIVPSFTFVATAHALQWQGITPVFCDIDPATHNLNPDLVEPLITPRTTGILGVHVWGRACEHDRLATIASRHNLKLLYDAAHAFGCASGGRMIGGLGDCEVFSFHATKIFNTFEGGAIATNSDELAAKLRLMRNFGFTGFDSVSHIGTNGKMNEICAAMGLTGLESMDAFIECNRRNYELYRAGLCGTRGICMLRLDVRAQHNFQYIVLEVDPSAGLTRDELLRVLEAENVLARRYFYPGCHRMEPYRTLYPDASRDLPHTEALASRVLVLPTGTAVSPSDIECTCRIIQTALRFPEECRNLLAARI